jgi:hypothetical protein
MDVASIADVEALAGELEGVPIDVLINNAGVYSDRSGCQDDNCRGEGEVRVPYLMMYSAANASMNDALLPGGAQRVAPPGTAHLNYHDAAVLVPGLRLLGAVGRANVKAFLRERNATVRDFHRSIAPR